MSNLIFNAFAYNQESLGSVNFDYAKENPVEVYCRLSCVSLFSAKQNNPDCDVAFITNTAVSDKWQSILGGFGIEVINVEFDAFLFADDVKWKLGYYKLCALDWVLGNLDYERILLLDADTYTQGALDNLWLEVDQGVVCLYDLQHSLDIAQAKGMNREYEELHRERKLIPNKGGEFICGTAHALEKFVSQCRIVYEEMAERGFASDYGDEFIISIAASRSPGMIKDAGAYIFRYWTAAGFYLVSTNFVCNPVAIFHTPDEKIRGLMMIYEYIARYGKLPQKTKVFKYLGFPLAKRRHSLACLLYAVKRKIRRLFGGGL